MAKGQSNVVNSFVDENLKNLEHGSVLLPESIGKCENLFMQIGNISGPVLGYMVEYN